MKALDLLRALESEDWLLAILLVGSCFLAATVLIQVSACSLCMTQRFFMAGGVIVIALALSHARAPLGYPIAAALCWFAGCAVALRQLWIQYVPGAASSCGPSVDFLIAYDYPLSSIVKTMFTGSGDCAEPSLIPLLALGSFLALLTLLMFHVKTRGAT